MEQRHENTTKRSGRTMRMRKKRPGGTTAITPTFQGTSALSLIDFPRRSSVMLLPSAQIVTCQLGYLPSNIVDIGAVSSQPSAGIKPSILYPLIIILYPLNANGLSGRYSSDGGLKPFPTTLWMTCPLLHSKVSKLEDQGWVQRLQQRLRHDKNSCEWLQMMRNAHQQYADMRWELLNSEDKEIVLSNGWTEALRDVGIAGIRHFDSVKCLHCHYAHFLSFPQHGNIVGQWVHELIDTIPDDPNLQEIITLLSAAAIETGGGNASTNGAGCDTVNGTCTPELDVADIPTVVAKQQNSAIISSEGIPTMGFAIISVMDENI